MDPRAPETSPDAPQKVYLSDLAQTLVRWEGEQFSLENYPSHKQFYDGDYRRTLFMMARQTAKTMTVAVRLATRMCAIDYYKAIHISPGDEQARRFSHLRMKPVLTKSPFIASKWLDTHEINNVYLKTFTNGSQLAVSFADTDPSRARGFSADECDFDEVQDIQYDEVIPVIEGCMDECKHGPYSVYAGTPKTMDNTVGFFWERSTKTAWAIPCEGCSIEGTPRHTVVMTLKAVGKVGPVCLHCQRPLNPRLGYWVDLSPNKPGENKIKGFHMPRPVIVSSVPAAWPIGPLRDRALKMWRENVLDRIDQPPPIGFSETKLMNEVMALPTGTGARLITEAALIARCGTHELLRVPTPEAKRSAVAHYMGVDWSGNDAQTTDSASRTVVWIWALHSNGLLRCTYYRIFPQGQATQWVPEIALIFTAWGCAAGVGDAGEGALPNALLRDQLGPHRWSQARYGNFADPASWHPEARAWHVDRTTMVDNFIRLILFDKSLTYGKRQAMLPAFTDMLSVYEQVTKSGKKVWLHPPLVPDDCLHAQIFAWIAFRIHTAAMKNFY